MSWQSQEAIVTPEAVRVEIPLAEAGSRGGALFLDLLITGLVYLFVVLILSQIITSEAGSEEQGLWIGAIFTVLYFLMNIGYFALFEGMWNGQTPGKRASKVRVRRLDGQPIGMREAFLRNLIRPVDLLFFGMVGLITITITKKRQRLGDLGAGTIVITEAPVAAPIPLHLPPAPPHAPGVDAAGITHEEYDVVRSYLLRRAGLPPEVRSALASQIVATLRTRTPNIVPPGISDDLFLEQVARAYGARSQHAPPAPVSWATPAPPPMAPPAMAPPPPPRAVSQPVSSPPVSSVTPPPEQPAPSPADPNTPIAPA